MRCPLADHFRPPMRRSESRLIVHSMAPTASSLTLHLAQQPLPGTAQRWLARILRINDLTVVTSDVIETARSTLVIGDT